ncbi:type II toxin-antitoxin system RelE/ParE family toxin [Reyranella sp. CPCC 100927]|uniref:type II toxin-antitoxin system RelE/ParE family toxin n=1 Tax=Reyranella sp. CPCC 100927 TaxID=2599616 RepID=UPI0011B55F7A|nr:type II toxin-antitoxin system RelE/ParE family toxin [Reyranella sp. CPCC 100927]TWS99672.1 type II toxin-antitoxin system RelE/ParE family toxin [Reyranella sp. CPCC 100927]
MIYRVEFRPEARQDLDDIFEHVAIDSTTRAYRFVARIQAACLSLSEMPRRGPLRNDIARGIRILPVGRRIVIAYRVEGQLVEIVNVFYGGRDYASILRDRRPQGTE